MQASTIKFWFLSGCILSYLLAPKPTTAQIVPDTTLPNNSIVNINGNTFNITGGTQAGGNLFHSFKDFSVRTDSGAFFNNAVDIQNIISRVTGGSISNIDGFIRANGSANLFLINPNGIVFGSKARLEIGGSFFASTASSLKFADGTEFRTDGTQTTPLLTISVPTGLQFGANPASIQNQSQFNGEVGLQVQPGKTLALVGGDVVLDGGFLTARGGRIELGSVAGNNSVSLKQIDQSWVLGYEGIQNFQDISLSNAAYVNTESDKGGDIQIQGRNVTLTGGSQVVSATKKNEAGNVKVSASEQLELAGATSLGPSGLFNRVRNGAQGGGGSLQIETKQLIVRDGAQISASTDGGQGVDLNVNASESVELTGGSAQNPAGLLARVQSGAKGKGGTLTIDTRQLIVRDGAQVSASTFGAGDAGNLIVNASELVKVEGRSSNNNPSGLFAQVQTISGQPTTGNAGNLTINTPKLEVLGGAQISTTARSQGSGGTVTINAPNSIFLSGASQQAQPTPDDRNRSGVFVLADTGSTKNAGVLNINTGVLTVENGARISAETRGFGNGGTANLDVGKLVIQNGGEVRAGSLSSGEGGNIDVKASESVQVIGTGTIGSTPVPSTLSAEATSSGKAGNLNIQTPRLDVRDGGQVTVRSQQGLGQAGSLTITANDIRLNNGKLTATTNAEVGGNIRLQNVDQLLMENNSLISAQAFNEAKGGNINIDAANGIIVGVPGQSNDIVANAVRGNGGNITITTSGIYGFRVGRSTPNTNDIDASSQFGLPGTVNINRSDVDPTQAFVELPADPVDPSTQIASSCAATNVATNGQFIISGRGGLPPNPNEPLSTDVIWSDTRIPNITAQQQPSQVTAVKPPSKQADVVKIVPATGWVFNGKGQVTLISSATTNNPHPSLQNSASCAAR
ncbi:filamentous hemagglutinin N-terminal domain-containing protein [Scytonema sp. PCC 10023]|uniref:two-partner secretion domain-containing protein n=1 Tax=Scytonema sp. PCC 10023 TaxID=1680591 RepID=UPI0039C6E81B